jgi:hypothetical protein
MDFSLAPAMAVLERTPATLDHMLRGLPADWIAGTEGPGTFSPWDNVGHLIHGEDTDWIPRATLILTDGDDRPFEPFDRFAHATRFKGLAIDALLDRFAERRAANLATLRGWSLTAAQLRRTGRHPELGPVTLSQLLACWVVHDLGHVAQTSRVMAKQYATAVGPWTAYLPVLTR